MTDTIFPTGSDIITEAQGVIGEVAGPGVQIFTEDQAYGALRRAFDLVFTKRAWEQYLRWGSYSLDGVNGKITDADPFGDVGSPDLSAFVGIFAAGSRVPIPLLSSRVNPLTYSGTSIRAWTSLPVSDSDYIKKRLQFWPKTATTDVNIQVKVHPGLIIDRTILYLDKMMLVMGTAWQILDADGTNPGAADTCKQLYDLRFRDIDRALAGQPMEVSSGAGVPTEWFER